MINIFTRIISTFLTAVVSVVSLFGYIPKTQIQQESLGATIPTVIALFETSLATKITSTATTMQLTSGTDKDGNALSGTYGFVIDEGTASEEFVLATCASTACTSMSRGVSVVTGNTEITALKKAHRRGSSVKISNHPQLAIVSRIANGDEDFPNNLTFNTFSENDTKLQYDSLPTITDDKDIISKKYADDLSYAGTPDGSLTTKGIFEMATLAELLSGTATGTTGAYLTAPTSLFATTTSASNIIPITDTDGLLDQGFLDLTENFDFSGTLTSSGSNLGFSDWIFGSGTDGEGTIATTTSLTRDMYYTDLTINTTEILDTNGYRVFVSGTLTNNGTISNDGGDGGAGGDGDDFNGTTGGTSGTAGTCGSGFYDCAVGVVGGDGGDTGAAPSVSASSGSSEYSFEDSDGADGGTGGLSGDGNSCTQCAGGTGGTATRVTDLANAIVAINTNYSNGNDLCPNAGAASGGGGRGGTTDPGAGGGGGGSGGGGGVVTIVARTLINNDTIQSIGGDGGAGGTGGDSEGATDDDAGGGGGGGGGGNGGIINLIYLVYTDNGDVLVTAGTGGAGGAAGAAGDGDAGVAGTSGSNGEAGEINYLSL